MTRRPWLECLYNRVSKLRNIAIQDNNLVKRVQADRIIRELTTRLNELQN
jgi:hypothetical protein